MSPECWAPDHGDYPHQLGPACPCPATTTEGPCTKLYGPELGDHIHRAEDGTFWAVRYVPRTHLDALADEWLGRRRTEA